jgi:2,3-bisphosphoglycerate-dependent phosphoglycerate mutase
MARAACRWDDTPETSQAERPVYRGTDVRAAARYHGRQDAMTEIMHKEYAKLRRRPFLTPVWLTVLGAFIAVALLAWAVLSASTTTIFVLRHAEALAGSGEDPSLSLAGQLRAERLRQVFGATGELGLDGVLVSEFRRSQETARPLASALGVPVIVVAAADPAVVARRALADFAGGRAMIIGQQNTIPGIVEALSGQKVAAMGEEDFATVYVVTRPKFSHASVSVLSLP